MSALTHRDRHQHVHPVPVGRGLFLIQTNAQPSTNSTMLSIHQNGEHDEFIQFDQILTDSSIIVMLDELEIRIDWDTKSVAIE